MSYAELAQHAARIEQLAVQESLKQKGWADLGNGEIRAPSDLTALGAQQIVQITQQEFADTAEMFMPFLHMPDPAALENICQVMRKAKFSLSRSPQGSTDPVTKEQVHANPVMNLMDEVPVTLAPWHGFAAEEFKTRFLQPWPAVATNQFNLVATLAGALRAEQALWEECRKNVDDIAHKAINALEVMEECGTKTQVCLLTVASSVFAVAAALATAGTGAAVALTVAGATAQALGGVPREDDPKVEFDGQSPQDILRQVQAALTTLAEVVNRKEGEIAEAMRSSAASLAANRSLFVSPRPVLADQSAAGVTTQNGLGEAP
ncbi:hypothetical protein AB0F81_36235 [Actinoplanes sp. NPDC024001]|uniref:hypothetical protein n=1 Tax=Actinoplanes sp. NPDC024001 TaxID=3154598 RepID=UPI0033FEE71A